MKQFEVAKKLNMSESNYGKLERGEIEPNIATITKLSTIFEVPVNDLTSEDPIYEIKNSNNSPLAIHYSSLNLTNEKLLETLNKFMDQLPVLTNQIAKSNESMIILIEKQNQIIQKMKANK